MVRKKRVTLGGAGGETPPSRKCVYMLTRLTFGCRNRRGWGKRGKRGKMRRRKGATAVSKAEKTARGKRSKGSLRGMRALVSPREGVDRGGASNANAQ